MSKINKGTAILKIVLRIILFPLVLLWLISRIFKCRKKRELDSIDIFNISQIDSLSGVEFENLLKELFEKQGYGVVMTKKSHDYGADLILKKRGETTVVQAKCYGKNIGIKAVQEIISARKHYRADKMFVATNRYFSKDAMVLASEHGVILIDRDVVTNLVREFSPKIEINGKKYIAMSSDEKQKIKAKYRFWI